MEEVIIRKDCILCKISLREESSLLLTVCIKCWNKWWAGANLQKYYLSDSESNFQFFLRKVREEQIKESIDVWNTK